MKVKEKVNYGIVFGVDFFGVCEGDKPKRTLESNSQ